MSKRKDAKAVARWEHDTRQWATDAGRDLAVDLYYDRDRYARPYGVGVVLDPGEKVWAEVPLRFNLDWMPPIKPGDQVPLPVRSWLVTSGRVFGRLADDRLYGHRWESAVGVRVDLTAGREVVSLDIEGQPTLAWSGPGIAPMAVAAIFHLYGPGAMIEHPGLAPLRTAPDWPQGPDQLTQP
jgi:hypothetical protein